MQKKPPPIPRTPCYHSGKHGQRRKRRYGSELEAMQAAARNEKRGGNGRFYYHCRHCGFWHLTSQDPTTIGMKWEGAEPA